MKDIEQLDRNLQGTELGEHLMEAAQFMFSQSQENLTRPMPWGDENYAAKRKAHNKPTTISDTGDLLQSGWPPEWKGNNRIEFGYDAPHAVPTEYGTPPHPVSGKRLIDWASRKLGKSQKEAKRIAYATAKIIKQEGMDPHPFIRPAIAAGVKRYNIQPRGTLL